MMKFVTAALAATALMAAPASAALIDFANEADTNGERGVASGTQITIDGINLELVAYRDGGDAISPYLDAGNAGLGACKVLDGNDQCVPGNDDNVTVQENLEVFFRNAAMDGDVTRDILGLVFRDVNHNLLGLGNDGLVEIQTSNGIMTDLFSTFIAMAAGGDAFFQNTIGIGMYFVDTEFYISAMDVSDVPLPAALPLMLAGLGGLGFASRRREQAA